MKFRAVGVIGRAPADDMDLPIRDNHPDVVPGCGQWRGLVPFPVRGVINLMRGNSNFIESAPSDGVDFTVDHCDADRAAGAAERRKLPPCIGRGITFKNEIEGPTWTSLVEHRMENTQTHALLIAASILAAPRLASQLDSFDSSARETVISEAVRDAEHVLRIINSQPSESKTESRRGLNDARTNSW